MALKDEPPCKKTLAEGGGVLIMGLPRSGTYSVAHAMRMLGHKHVFHNLDVPLNKSNDIWAGWFQAGWACMPYVREESGLPFFAKTAPLPPTVFTKADWDALVGREYQVVSDISVYFAAELMEAYPDAQVILWERDWDRWYTSFNEGVLQGFGFDSSLAMFVRRFITPFSGIYWPTTQWYGNAGWLRAKDAQGMRANAKQRCLDHLHTVRKMAQPTKLLEYRLEDGWGPLCKFLNCPIPREPFQ